MSVLLNFAIFPMDKGDSVSSYVAQVIAMVRDSGYAYRLNPMGTTIETNTLSQSLAVVDRAHEILAERSDRVYITVNIDSRKGELGRLTEKIKRVEGIIGEVST